MQYRDHTLYLEDVPLADIARREGTPCYVYSRAAILERFDAYDQAFGDVPHKICYAVKANGNLAILKMLAGRRRGFRYRLRRRTVSRAEGRRRSRRA